MTCNLPETAGDEPVECTIAVGPILKNIQEGTAPRTLPLSIWPTKGQYGPKSGLVVVHGLDVARFAQA